MPRLLTAHFGEIEYDSDTIVEFPAGLPAFEQERGFLLLRDGRYDPLVILQSVATQSLAFLAIHVEDVILEYELELNDEDLALLGSGSIREGNLQAMALVTVSEAGSVTANLQAPLVFNPGTKRAVQVIQSRWGHSAHHPLGGPREAGEPACS